MPKLNFRPLLLFGIVALSVAYGEPANAEPLRNATTFHVAISGNDAWTGLLSAPNTAANDGPFASLARARDAIRALKKAHGGLKRPVKVVVHDGTYFLAEPLTFAAKDSGTAECPITYMAAKGATPRLSGGQTIQGWQPDTDGAWTVTLPEVRQGDWEFRQLFVSAPKQPYFQRRYRPDVGSLVIAGLTDAPVRKSTQAHTRTQQEFRFFPGDIKRWKNPGDLEIVALHDWSCSRLRIAQLDWQRHVVRFTDHPVYRIGHWFKDGRNPYFVENVAEQFGEPGRWYLDRTTGALRYRPLETEDMKRLVTVAPKTEQLLRLSGNAEQGAFVEHLRFERLTFSHTHWTLPPKGYGSRQGMIDLPAAIDATAARNCRWDSCTMAHLGGYAVRLGAGCRDNTIVGCRMFDLGGGGVMVGVTDRHASPVILPTGNRIQNNVISDGGLVHYSAHGVWIGIAARTDLSHNIIRRFLYSNVSVGWSWDDSPTACRENVIQYNHIHDAMMLLADGGGIYSLGQQPGTVLRGNLIHTIHRSQFAGRAPNNGIFFDQGSKRFLVEGNIIYNTAAEAIRYNQTQKDWHTFRGNSLDVKPNEKGFPSDAAAKAGLLPPYRHLDAQPIAVTPTPILSMKVNR